MNRLRLSDRALFVPTEHGLRVLTADARHLLSGDAAAPLFAQLRHALDGRYSATEIVDASPPEVRDRVATVLSQLDAAGAFAPPPPSPPRCLAWRPRAADGIPGLGAVFDVEASADVLLTDDRAAVWSHLDVLTQRERPLAVVLVASLPLDSVERAFLTELARSMATRSTSAVFEAGERGLCEGVLTTEASAPAWEQQLSLVEATLVPQVPLVGAVAALDGLPLLVQTLGLDVSVVRQCAADGFLASLACGSLVFHADRSAAVCRLRALEARAWTLRDRDARPGLVDLGESAEAAGRMAVASARAAQRDGVDLSARSLSLPGGVHALEAGGRWVVRWSEAEAVTAALVAALGAAQGVSVDARIATSPPDPEGAGEALVRVLPGDEPRVDSIDVWGRRLYGVRDDG